MALTSWLSIYNVYCSSRRIFCFTELISSEVFKNFKLIQAGSLTNWEFKRLGFVESIFRSNLETYSVEYPRFEVCWEAIRLNSP